MSESSFPAILTAIDVLNEHGSRVGRTHIHKFLFLAESWGLLPPAHRFSLYLHGPYSRDLDGELLALRAAGLVVASPDAAGYGAQYAVSPEHAQSARENLGDAAADPRPRDHREDSGTYGRPGSRGDFNRGVHSPAGTKCIERSGDYGRSCPQAAPRVRKRSRERSRCWESYAKRPVCLSEASARSQRTHPGPKGSWSGCPDLNRGPLRPERSTLPG